MPQRRAAVQQLFTPVDPQIFNGKTCARFPSPDRDRCLGRQTLPRRIAPTRRCALLGALRKSLPAPGDERSFGLSPALTGARPQIDASVFRDYAAACALRYPYVWVAMGVITILCPRTGQQVSTGIEVSREHFEGMRATKFLMRCGACGEEHTWSKRWATFSEEPPAKEGYHQGRAEPR